MKVFSASYLEGTPVWLAGGGREHPTACSSVLGVTRPSSLWRQEVSHISCRVRSRHQDSQAVFQLITATTLSPLPRIRPHQNHCTARFSANSRSAGARYRESAVSLSSPQVPLDSLILHAEWVCSLSRVGRRSSPVWEKRWHQGHLIKPPGRSGRLPFVSAAQRSHGAQPVRPSRKSG